MGTVNDQSSRDAMENRDFSGLRAMFDTIVKPTSRPVVDGARVRLLANLAVTPVPRNERSWR